MKTNKTIVSFGVLTGTLLLSGCMAMMPAMMLGHAAHGKTSALQSQNVKSCECERPAGPKPDAQPAPAAPVDNEPASPPGGEHKH